MTGNMGNEVVAVKSNTIPGSVRRHVHLHGRISILCSAKDTSYRIQALSQPEYAANEKVNRSGLEAGSTVSGYRPGPL